jgi:hypothetical protein
MAGKEKPNQTVHRLINGERRKRGLPWVRWNQRLYLLAKDQSNYCAKVGRLVHSRQSKLQKGGARGENLCGGKGDMSPRAIVKCWMNSKAGHREALLNPKAKTAGTAISHSRHGTYAAWIFSDEALHFSAKPKMPSLQSHRAKGSEGISKKRKSKLVLIAAIAIIAVIILIYTFVF